MHLIHVPYDILLHMIHNLDVASFLTHILPWIIAIPFLTGSMLMTFSNWTALIFIAAANFVIPLIIYIRASQFREQYNSKRRNSPHPYMTLNISGSTNCTSKNPFKDNSLVFSYDPQLH